MTPESLRAEARQLRDRARSMTGATDELLLLARALESVATSIDGKVIDGDV